MLGLYGYIGTVMEFKNIVARNWEGTTYAESEKKARSNLIFQYKKLHNKPITTKITLPGKIILIDKCWST